MSLFPLLNYEWKKSSDTDKGGSDDSSYLEIEEDDDFHNDSSDNSSNSSLIALLTAAATAYMGSSSDVKVRVTSFKRIPQTSPVWNTVGRSSIYQINYSFKSIIYYEDYKKSKRKIKVIKKDEYTC